MPETSPFESHDLWLLPGGKPRGVVLLTHGLNGNPASLDPLAAVLLKQGLAVYRTSFSGHRANNEEFLTVRSSQWSDDARRFHATARNRAQELGVPLHQIAYSMSGLIFQALRDELRFDRRVFFAPALAMHYWYEPAMLLARAVPWLKFRSKIPPGYNANTVSGLRSAIALHDFHRRWKGEPDQIPTLLWCDPSDELVSGPGLKKLAARSPAWELRDVSIAGCTLNVRYHHLIIDEPSLGKQEWERVSQGTAAFLVSDTFFIRRACSGGERAGSFPKL